MIAIKLNDDNFEYDIYSLVKAFYPKEDIIFTKDIPGKEVSYFLVINYVYDRRGRSDYIECKLYKPNSSDFDKIYDDKSDVNYSDRKDTKNRLKRLIYYCLSKETSKELSWGTLNGIRPVKIPLNMIEEGKSDDEIRDFMKDTYLTCEEKIDLTIGIARREHELIKGIDEKTDYSIYIGIPFCPSRCLYCSFTSYPYNTWQDRVDEYLGALRREMEFISSSLQDKNLTTVYIGGGTPTSLDEESLERLLGMMDEYFPIESLKEYNIEAGRADSITDKKLRIMRSHNVSRISVNPQSMNDKTLKLIGRAHTSQDVIKSFELAKKHGFDNINMDIIVGLPGEDINDLTYTLDIIEKLKPDSLTVHSLAIKRSARLNTERSLYEGYEFNNSKEYMDKATNSATNLGMNPYYLYRQKNMTGNLENIGFATPGKEGLYNVLIMEEKQNIIALGAGAYSKYVTDGGKTVKRSENVKDPGLYIDRIEEMIDRKRKKLEEMGWLKD